MDTLALGVDSGYRWIHSQFDLWCGLGWFPVWTLPIPQASGQYFTLASSFEPQAPLVFSGGDIGTQDQTHTVATHKYVKGINDVCLQRLDGRQTYDYRNIRISFGTDYGCCIVELGKTR